MTSLHRFIGLVLCCVVSLSAMADNLKGASLGFVVCDAVTGKTLHAENPDLCMTPASITKLITTATALELLGPGFRFETGLEYDGRLTHDSILTGNLYIRGGGDPTLGSASFAQSDILKRFAQQIRRGGIRRIEGNVVGDASYYDKQPLPIGWTWQDIGNYYAAGVYGLSIYENKLTVAFRSGSVGTTPEIISVVPPLRDVVFDNQLTARNGGGDSIYFYGMPYDNHRWLFGGLPANREHFEASGDIPNPPLAAAQFLIEALRAEGITVIGKATDVLPDAAERTRLFTHQSPSLAEIVTRTNVHSVNLYAESLVKQLSLLRSPVGNNSVGLNVLRDFWQSKGLDVSTLFLLDGSGLSPHNAFSARFLTDVLCYMNTKSAYREAFVASLPIAGESGTVRNFLKNSPLKGKAALKSGSIARVQCYAGYITVGKKTYAVTIMLNNFTGKRSDIVRYIEQRLTDALPKH